MTYLPAFQPQNPALNGDPYGWQGCACYCEAMAADFATAGRVKITGQQVRAASDEPIPDKRSPGLNLGQVNRAGVALGAPSFDVHTNTLTALPWSRVRYAIEVEKRGVHVAGWYAPIRDSPYGGSDTFFANHGIFIAPGWIGFDPLADGRRPGLYKYHGASYPPDLLRRFAGLLNIATSGYRALGLGQAFANITPAPPSSGGGGEEPLDVYRFKPGLLCSVRAGGTLYADPDRHEVLIPNWGGGTDIQLYARPKRATLPDGRSELCMVLIDLQSGSGEDLVVGYPGWDLVSNVREAPGLP